MKKNILEVCLSPDIGGLELCALDYFNYFNTHTSTYFCVSPNQKLDNHFTHKNKFKLIRNKFFPIVPAFKLAKFIDEKEIDIIHFHWTKDIATVVLAKLLSKRKPKVMQSRHMSITRFKDDFYHKWLYKNLDIIHAVTYQVKEQLQKYIPEGIRPQIEMIYLGVDEPTLNISKVQSLKTKYNLQDSFVVGIIGRIEEGKGQYLVIEAIARLIYLDIKVLVVGSAMQESYLSSLMLKAKELGVEEKIIFTGFTRDINEHMKLCDVTVLATPKETFGLVVIESMVNNVPVIATANGGPLEIINDLHDGLLFDRTTEDLVKKIEMLYTNAKLRDEMALNGYETVKNKFDKQKQMKKMYELINV